MHKPNKLLESDVQEELDWDPELDDSRIVVSADDGRVTLTGAVPTFYETMRAGDDVREVGGVVGVDNQLLVGLLGDAITDAELAVMCSDALNADRFVPKGSVAADVLDGYVTLNGTVRRHFQRRAAEHVVSRLDGVLGIHDKIELSSEPIPSDVAARIEKAFSRNAIIDESAIKVTNDGHTIYLDGIAGSWSARNAAEDTAWDAPGVDNVVDRIQVTQ
jgi:osmotically-inducible protein OsmY